MEEESIPTRVWSFFVTPMSVYAGRGDHQSDTDIQKTSFVVAAYKYAFNLATPVSSRLICDINNLVLYGKESNKNKTIKFVYRKKPVHFPLIAASDLNYTMTLEGLNELIDACFIQAEKPRDYLHFKSQSKSDEKYDYYVHPVINRKGPPHALKFEIRGLGHAGKVLSQKFISDQKEIREEIEKLAKSSKNYLCYFNPVNECFFVRNNAKNVQLTIHLKMKSSEESFREDIGSAKSSDEKLRMIIEYVQKVQRLQPFSEELNKIAVEVFLNRLLHEHGMPMSILMDSKRMRGCSLEQVIVDVKNGQQIFLDMMCGAKNLEFIDKIRENSDREIPAEIEVNGFSKENDLEMMLDICLENIVRTQMKDHPEIVEKSILTIFKCETLDEALEESKKKEHVSESSSERVAEIVKQLMEKQKQRQQKSSKNKKRNAKRKARAKRKKEAEKQKRLEEGSGADKDGKKLFEPGASFWEKSTGSDGKTSAPISKALEDNKKTDAGNDNNFTPEY